MTDISEEILSEEQELILIHKKQRKELQAKIQVLKKSICKGDKKKKKEITDEIFKMELDLNKKQEEETARLKLSQMSIEKTRVEIEDSLVDEADEIENDKNNQGLKPSNKVSKAQRRKEKKENAERERNQRILEQEVLNIHGKRNVEIQAITSILIKRNLMIYEIPSDGHCLYNAVAHQLKIIGDTPTVDLHDLRRKTALHLKENTDTFLPFIHNSDSDQLLSIEQYERYCNDVAETNAWGGAIELQVLSNILKCPIEVIQASGIPYIVGSEFEPTRKLILTYHRHMYQLGAHYNSVIKYIANKEDS